MLEAALQPLDQTTAAATFSQSAPPLTPTQAADGITTGLNGWAINPNEADQIAVFEFITPFGGASGTNLIFTLYQNYGAQHTIGKFRLSLTTDSKSDFADGNASGGDVTATWVEVDPLSVSATNGATLTETGANQILASGTSPDTSVYTITAFTSLQNITGVRLEVFEDVSLPQSGPGRQPLNGNFVLNELTVDAIAAVPEPATLCIWAGLGLIAAGGAYRRRKASAA